MKKRILILLFSVYCLPIQGIGGDLDDYAKDYLIKMEKNNTAVFITKCKSKKDPKYTVTLLFPSYSKEGLLIEKKENVVVNLATIIITSKGLKIEETHGGVYTYNRVLNLAKELSNKKFLFFAPLSIDKFNRIEPFEICSYSP